MPRTLTPTHGIPSLSVRMCVCLHICAGQQGHNFPKAPRSLHRGLSNPGGPHCQARERPLRGAAAAWGRLGAGGEGTSFKLQDQEVVLEYLRFFVQS